MPLRRLALLLAFPLAACAKQPPPTVSPAPADAALAPSAAPPAYPTVAEIQVPAPEHGILPGAADKILPPGHGTLVKLLDAGAEPRTPLAYALATSSAAKLEISIGRAIDTKVGGKAQPEQSTPTFVLDVGVTVRSRQDREWNIATKLASAAMGTDSPVPQGRAAAVKARLASIAGFGIDYWADAQGQVRDVKLDVPKTFPEHAEGTQDELTHAFDAIVCPLPVEPVGIGARWQAVTRAEAQGSGADILRLTRYTLEARHGTKATLDVHTDEFVANDALKAAESPKGTTVRVTAFESGAAGTSKIDTTSVAPDDTLLMLKSAITVLVEGFGADMIHPADNETTVETNSTITAKRR